MLCANLSVYDAGLDEMSDQVTVVFDDPTISKVLAHLEAGNGRVHLQFSAENAEGNPVQVNFEWVSSLGALSANVKGMSAGFVFHDELKGAYQKPMPLNYRPCTVCLSSELDIWRRGVIDLDSGLVTAYTATRGLSTLGATAYLTDSKSLAVGGSSEENSLEAIYVPLSYGEAAEKPLMVSRSDLDRIRNQVTVYEQPEQAEKEPFETAAMRSLRSLMEQVCDVPEPVTKPHERPSKGLS